MAVQSAQFVMVNPIRVRGFPIGAKPNKALAPAAVIGGKAPVEGSFRMVGLPEGDDTQQEAEAQYREESAHSQTLTRRGRQPILGPGQPLHGGGAVGADRHVCDRIGGGCGPIPRPAHLLRRLQFPRNPSPLHRP